MNKVNGKPNEVASNLYLDAKRQLLVVEQVVMRTALGNFKIYAVYRLSRGTIGSQVGVE